MLDIKELCVGDEVKIIDNLPIYRTGLTRRMRQYAGMTGIITWISPNPRSEKDGSVLLDVDDGNFCWFMDILEPANVELPKMDFSFADLITARNTI